MQNYEEPTVVKEGDFRTATAGFGNVVLEFETNTRYA